ncbi:FtsJ domain-containing protein [Mycena chlorophos]|uniref:FtsJ domain-containing protein n=1 Tax=Mycena chlorophos TaxID=658473 RepID=A0A8H6TT49_MYCCL|nr:FtsJ domain-containing protein [Mycena chlorophos]
MAVPETPSSSQPSSPSTAYFDSADSSPCTSPASSTAPTAVAGAGWADMCGPRTLTQDLVAHGADELRLLHDVRIQVSSTSSAEDESYAQFGKKVADNAPLRHNRYWFSKMKHVLKEIDDQTACIPRRGPLRFLDLGCCPGGFTSYILSKNLAAQGHGISSEIETGGPRFLLEDRHRARFKISYADLSYYRLGPLPADVATKQQTKLKPVAGLPFDTTKRPFDIVLLDGHPLRCAGDPDRLLVSQLIMGLQWVKPGGTLIIRLADPEQAATAKLLFMLDGLSTRIDTAKPRFVNATRSTFYVVAQGVGAGVGASCQPILIAKLKELWVDLMIGGVHGAGRALNEEDLDFVVTTKELQQPEHLGRIVELSKRVWEVQARALSGDRDPHPRAAAECDVLSEEGVSVVDHSVVI